MGWIEIATFAEILASLGVIGSLILVALQLRHNTVIMQNSTYQNRASLIGDWARPLAENSELYSIYRRGLKDDTQLTADERGRFDLILLQNYNSIEAVHQQMRSGRVTEDIWKQNMTMLGVTISMPGGRSSWERQQKVFLEDFKAEVEVYFPRTSAKDLPQ